jgi:hypothetical protein
MDIAIILLDMQQNSPAEVNFPPPPYSSEKNFKDKFQITYRNLVKSMRLRNRTLSLVNSFYLGKLLDDLSTPNERLVYKKKMTLHYATIVERTFDLFEYCPDQLLRTQILNVQAIRKMKQVNILELRNKMILFAGAENLEEEPVSLDNLDILDYCA